MEPEKLLEGLSRPFPAKDHQTRKLPGGSDGYVFVKWRAVRNRLNELCGLDWEISYTDPVCNGDYLTVRCQLTIAGKTREGMGTTKTYPDRNDEGKEKIIGTPAQNAAALALKNAAKAFGIGTYLEDQTQTKEWLQQVNHNRHRINQKMKQLRFNRGDVEQIIEDNEFSDIEFMSLDECDRLINLMEAEASLRSEPVA